MNKNIILILALVIAVLVGLLLSRRSARVIPPAVKIPLKLDTSAPKFPQ